MPRLPRVLTIPGSSPFLPTLIRALGDGRIIPGFPAAGDPLAWSRATLYLPTRRACRLAREVFLDVLATDAAVLPRIVALGDIDEDELAFSAATGVAAELSLELPPTLSSLERRLLLTCLVQQWAGSQELRGSGAAPLVARHPAAALALADDLARLMDDMTTRQVPWDRLEDLVPDRFDVYWQLSLRFLDIARHAWPAILAERGLMEPAARRDRLMAAEAARLEASPSAPVVAAGSTGSMPATAALLATIAKLPLGAVVLPGLDMHLDPASWREIGGGNDTPGEAMPAHPQFAMQQLIARIEVPRELVQELVPSSGRDRFLCEAFRPAATTGRWQGRADEAVIRPGLNELAMIEAANAEEEALAIAVALREALEASAGTVALVTADRALARRVVAALGRWRIAAEESGGIPLAETPSGILARLAATAALSGTAPATLLALLKHPLCALGTGADANRAPIAALERAVLRGPAPRPGTKGLADALDGFRRDRGRLHPNDPRGVVESADLDGAADLVARLAAALAPLETMPARPLRLNEIVRRHREVVDAVCRDGADGSRGAADEHGVALTVVFEELESRPAAGELTVAPDDYADLFRDLIADRVVRKRRRSDAPILILGPLEARLQGFDTVVLGGLVEGSWPPEIPSDPWLSRPLRRELGLDLPERRIGLSAHDFVQALGTPRVILSRAAKLAGTPMVPSRFLRRLAAVAGEEHWQKARSRGERLLQLARALDRSPSVRRLEAPQPRPPRAARPTYLTVTDVEHWLRDPYTIYAKHVLRLFPFDPVNTPPGARDRGNLVHAAISEFTRNSIDRWPDDPLAELLRLGRKHFASVEDYPEARAFWWPRFLRVARWFVDWHGARRADVGKTLAETRGELSIALPDRTFRLAARADRIDALTGGRYAIIDYKTGQAPTEKQVRTGLSPQLTLEAAILRSGGFVGVPPGAAVEMLTYVTLRGGDPPGAVETIEFEEGTPDIHADRALTRFTELVRRFEAEDQPFRSLVHPMWKARYGDYDHLARVKEWSATGAEPEGAMPP